MSKGMTLTTKAGIEIQCDPTLPRATWLAYDQRGKLVCFCMGGCQMWSGQPGVCVSCRVSPELFEEIARTAVER